MGLEVKIPITKNPNVLQIFLHNSQVFIFNIFIGNVTVGISTIIISGVTFFHLFLKLNQISNFYGLQCQGVLLSIIPHSLMELWVISLSMSMSFIFSDFFIFHRKLKTKHLMLLIITGEVILLLSAFIEGQLDEYLLRKVLNIG
ncbi:hypothetical protein DSM07_04770 [Oenococcus sp. UCMA 16435]|nr:hypothetical protein DSM07_04770 [Oenococcus sp. UCMA 16435]MDI4583857.1 hypothetical protein [Oenococcus sp. UCMA 14587]